VRTNDVTSASLAVAVMAKAPGFAPVKSRLQPPLTADEARALATAFLLDRLDAVAALSGAAALLAFAPPEAAAALRTLAPASVRLLAQRGDELGERLTHLFDDLLAEHAAALVLDADSPTLPMAWVSDGLQTLAAGTADVVLGPADDGGYWGIGVRASCPKLFADVPWSTDRVLATTLARAEVLGLRVRLLPRWFDVDTEADLRRLCDEVSASGGPWRTAALVPVLAARLAAAAAR
jgi:rSAM/selenodomain-associated transferase 1